MDIKHVLIQEQERKRIREKERYQEEQLFVSQYQTLFRHISSWVQCNADVNLLKVEIDHKPVRDGLPQQLVMTLKNIVILVIPYKKRLNQHDEIGAVIREKENYNNDVRIECLHNQWYTVDEKRSLNQESLLQLIDGIIKKAFQ